MTVAAAILVAVPVLLTAALILAMFFWAAVKDGEEDKAVQARLGIRRRTLPSLPEPGAGQYRPPAPRGYSSTTGRRIWQANMGPRKRGARDHRLGNPGRPRRLVP